ncbi:MAG: hypothetical protein H6707_04430 [Deltaproteobacteria bacterium]|nr:hypothetical protein [Deltaproteobacteria bacterium]
MKRANPLPRRTNPFFQWASVIAAIVLLAGCKKQSAEQPTTAPEATAKETAPSAPVQRPLTPAAKAAHMRDHFTKAAVVNQAILSGNLAAAKQAATWLVEHKDPAPPQTWNVEPLRLAARRVAEASNLTTAGAALGELAATCGSCHVAMKTNIKFADELLVSGGTDIKERMRRHVWATKRFWEGLVIPSDEKWAGAAHLLHEKALRELPNVKDQAKLKAAQQAAQSVHDLGKAALSTKDLAMRAQLYGQLAATCAGCHKLIRPPKAELATIR